VPTYQLTIVMVFLLCQVVIRIIKVYFTTQESAVIGGHIQAMIQTLHGIEVWEVIITTYFGTILKKRVDSRLDALKIKILDMFGKLFRNKKNCSL
jgi:hypothetical protein